MCNSTFCHLSVLFCLNPFIYVCADSAYIEVDQRYKDLNDPLVYGVSM